VHIDPSTFVWSYWTCPAASIWRPRGQRCIGNTSSRVYRTLIVSFVVGSRFASRSSETLRQRPGASIDVYQIWCTPF
jgi:hypothetical protein